MKTMTKAELEALKNDAMACFKTRLAQHLITKAEWTRMTAAYLAQYERALEAL